jgi:PEP-CTERM motif
MHVFCTYNARMKPYPLHLSGRTICFGLLLSFFLLGPAPSGHAAESATATISNTPAGGGDFNYTLTLNNTGTTTIGTFWFSWVPGQDYMNSAPISTSPPAGWAANITHGGSTDGYAIQWLASTATSDLAAGSSLTFSFESAVTPTEIAGDSPFSAHPPEGTAFIYSGVPFSDGGVELVVESVPEPSALGLLVVGALGISLMGWRRLQTRL